MNLKEPARDLDEIQIQPLEVPVTCSQISISLCSGARLDANGERKLLIDAGEPAYMRSDSTSAEKDKNFQMKHRAVLAESKPVAISRSQDSMDCAPF